MLLIFIISCTERGLQSCSTGRTRRSVPPPHSPVAWRRKERSAPPSLALIPNGQPQAFSGGGAPLDAVLVGPWPGAAHDVIMTLSRRAATEAWRLLGHLKETLGHPRRASWAVRSRRCRQCLCFMRKMLAAVSRVLSGASQKPQKRRGPGSRQGPCGLPPSRHPAPAAGPSCAPGEVSVLKRHSEVVLIGVTAGLGILVIPPGLDTALSTGRDCQKVRGLPL
ncbi:uncharacterized protein LOC111533570 [Piliocolobus tephrosceles]|uniref:uncharacterized protein LOC111533570 n=1 Tax=Piliocolobus tephrosceles TaxID=591936 RepID=UPI000C29EFBC|nr:uncharacterized protein LOC111533570 [Piliocolobus tephrosceles]